MGDLVSEWKSLFEMLSESTAEQQGKWWLLHVVAVCGPRCECFGSLRDGCGWEGFLNPTQNWSSAYKNFHRECHEMFLQDSQ